jgi:hypothetical protein
MGRNKPQTHRPPKPKPQGEQQLSNSAWTEIVKVIRSMSAPHAT